MKRFLLPLVVLLTLASVPLVYAGALSGSLTFTVNGLPRTQSSFDIYKFHFKEKEKVEVAIAGDGDTDLDLFVDDSGGKRLVSQTGKTDKEKGAFTPAKTGAFTIRVFNNSDKVFNKYKFEVKCASEVAGPIQVTRSLKAKDEDVFKFSFEGGKEAKVRITGDGSTELELRVEGASGKEVSKSSGKTDEVVTTWTPEKTAPYTIRVKNLDAKQYNRYTLKTN
jgi:hypothetical protein